jgi:hypothetical protein
MTGLGAIGPEFVLQLALAQWSSACRSVKAFRSLRYEKWTMTHAFLADMGGFVLHAEDGMFPLNSEQVLYLVEKRHVDVSDVVVEKRVIEDKNKGDKMARFLTVCQILWFSINSVARLIQHLAITTLELTTLGFIICTLGTYFFWAHKPMDILTPITLTLVPNLTMADILEREGSGAPANKRAPLDFVPRKEWTSWMLYWTYWMNILRKLGIDFHPANRPIVKIADDYTPALSPWGLLVLFLFHTSYAAVHIAGWNFHFPTQTEATAWHAATIIVMAAICGCWATDVWTWKLWPAIKKQFVKPQDNTGAVLPPAHPEPKVLENSAPRETPPTQHTVPTIRNNSPDHDPNLRVPLEAIIPITLFAASYVLARGFILIEDLVNLISQPASAFETINWANFLPHL